ncbi:ashwin isoform 2-T2 [Podargus strigoides]
MGFRTPGRSRVAKLVVIQLKPGTRPVCHCERTTICGRACASIPTQRLGVSEDVVRQAIEGEVEKTFPGFTHHLHSCQARRSHSMDTSQQDQAIHITRMDCQTRGTFTLKINLRVMEFWVIFLVVMWGSAEVNADLDEKLILSLKQGLGSMHNLTSATACIPIPHSAGQPIPWDVIPVNSSLLEEYDNITEATQTAILTYYVDSEGKCKKQESSQTSTGNTINWHYTNTSCINALKNILVENEVKKDKDGLTDLYIQHAIPLPQRDLPKSRWGKMMEKKRQQNELKSENKSVTSVEGLRKRPLIVFDGNSTSTSIKVKKTENGAADCLKPPPAGSTTNTVRRLSVPSNTSTYISASSLSEDAKLGMRINEAKKNNISKTNSSVLTSLKVYPLSPVAGTTVVKLKRAVPKEESDLPNDLKPTEAKKKIQHVTWP